MKGVKRGIKLLRQEDLLDQEEADDRQRTETDVFCDQPAFAVIAVTGPQQQQSNDKQHGCDRQDRRDQQGKHHISPAHTLLITVHVAHQLIVQIASHLIIRICDVRVFGNGNAERQHISDLHHLAFLHELGIGHGLFRGVPSNFQSPFENLYGPVSVRADGNGILAVPGDQYRDLIVADPQIMIRTDVQDAGLQGLERHVLPEDRDVRVADDVKLRILGRSAV